MIECIFCFSPSKDQYIYTECNHLICIDCASNKWDGRYSLKCCNQLTFLSEETTEALIQSNRIKMHVRTNNSKEKEEGFDYIRTSLQVSRNKENLEQSYCQKIKLEESELIRSITPKKQPVYEEEEQRQSALTQMEKLLSDQVAKVKCNYQTMRKELERKEQIMLKELYNTYSDHLNSLKNSCSTKDVCLLKDKFEKIGEPEPVRIDFEREESRSDKILQKLDYNQQKMREKLHKHYELLK